MGFTYLTALTLISPAALLVGFAWAVVLGMLWYGPLLFVRPWLRASGLQARMDAGERQPVRRTMLLGLLVAALEVGVAGAFFMATAAITPGEHLQIALALWLASSLAVAGTTVWENRPAAYLAVHAGERLVRYMVLALIFAYL